MKTLVVGMTQTQVANSGRTWATKSKARTDSPRTYGTSSTSFSPSTATVAPLLETTRKALTTRQISTSNS